MQALPRPSTCRASTLPTARNRRVHLQLLPATAACLRHYAASHAVRCSCRCPPLHPPAEGSKSIADGLMLCRAGSSKAILAALAATLLVAVMVDMVTRLMAMPSRCNDSASTPAHTHATTPVQCRKTHTLGVQGRCICMRQAHWPRVERQV
jgi:hypothetical protein